MSSAAVSWPVSGSSADSSSVEVLVVPTNEELAIARQVAVVLGS